MILQKLLLSLGLIALGLITGQTARHLINSGQIRQDAPVERYMKTAQNTVLLVLSPFINICTFWIVRITDMRFMALPVLGVVGLMMGGVIALAYSRLFKHTRRQTGAMFTSGSFTNMGTFGGLVSFAFLGEASYAFASMYRLLEDFVYFTLGYPIAKLYGESDKGASGQESPLRRLLSDRFIRVYVLSMVVGTSLNISGLTRPQVLSTVTALLIPVTSFILVTTVGFKMRLGAIKENLREALAIGSIKFVIVPIAMFTIAYHMGIGSLYDGMVLKVVLILSSMPPAFLSLIPPQIYDLDVDLANSSWLVNTGALVIVLPVLYLVQSML